MSDERRLEKEDYTDDMCLLCDPVTGRKYGSAAVPMARVTEKLDELVAREEYDAAARHLDYWLSEAVYTGDRRGEFSLRNEMMGFWRKQGNSVKAFESLEAALILMRQLDMEKTLSAGTCYVNCGTVCTAFSQPERALGYFEKAREIWEANPSSVEPSSLAGLYNNMALALMDCGRYEESLEGFGKALDITEASGGGKLHRAVTLMNMADCTVLEKGDAVSFSDIEDYVRKAMDLMEDPSAVRDSYYAFVCGRLAPGFDYYGFTEYASVLTERAEKILGGKKI
ncbi:MAG: tetratricopeptide repeat protein [Eubacteriaceae bacterium]|nr:tetratricopeptide repeat protein [Eubacteriaceae bacterium]